jgi:transposase
MLYNEKARKDGAAFETVEVDDDKPTTSFEFQRMTMASIRKKQVRRAVEYGPYIPTLVRLLEEGYFE